MTLGYAEYAAEFPRVGHERQRNAPATGDLGAFAVGEYAHELVENTAEYGNVVVGKQFVFAASRDSRFLIPLDIRYYRRGNRKVIGIQLEVRRVIAESLVTAFASTPAIFASSAKYPSSSSYGISLTRVVKGFST